MVCVGDCNIPANATLIYDINFVGIYSGNRKQRVNNQLLENILEAHRGKLVSAGHSNYDFSEVLDKVELDNRVFHSFELYYTPSVQ